MKEPCPKCRESGGDTAGDNLARYPDGGAYCFVCKYREPPGNREAKPRMSKLTVDQVKTYPVGANPARCIPHEVADLYDVRVSYDEATGEAVTLYYPYYQGGKMASCKTRRVDSKDFFWVGTPSTLFGKQACVGSSILIITEGEEDALAVKTVLTDRVYGVEQTHDVVSLPNGASLDKIVRAEVEFFEKYKRVYICFDNDEQGKKAGIEVADWLSTITGTYLVQLSTELGKDASDYLVSGHGKELRQSFAKAKLYEPEGVVNGVDISLSSLLSPLEEGYPLPFKGMQDKLHGIRKAEIITLCAGSGIGKSTLAREIAKSLIEQGCSVANVALEDQMNVAAQALIALDMNIPLNKFRFSPPPEEVVKPHYDKMIANGRTYFYKHFGGLNSENMMNRLYYYARSKACDFIILDHLSMVISASGGTNERKDIDTLMTNLAKMVVETGVGLIQIVHLKRTQGDKSFAKGGEVELTDLRGSAALEQLSWAVVGLERDQQGDDSDFTRVRILKNRTFGFTGLCDILKFDTSTGRLKNVVLDPAGD